MRRAAVVWAVALSGLAGMTSGLAANVVPPTPPDCGSVVIIKCDPPPAAEPRREASRRVEAGRTNPTEVMDRIIIEDDAVRPDSPESVINRALARPFVAPGEHSFSIGEGAQCTCKNVCPPWPLPCCNCTEQVGNRHATSPGWKPTN